jgi:RNA polymerase sigma factor (sigma-70 family)
MATRQMSRVLQHLRSTLLAREAKGLMDGQLVECFVRHGEPAAVEALVRRHAAMVWGVCRRLLGDHHDAEDAFQATFLVLVRKAASVKPREMVGNWLYGVARQTALKARTARTKRRKREGPQTIMPDPAVMAQDSWDDLQPLLDQELARLPDKYRAAIVLCELEGKSRQEAALSLGCPEGTVASRLARARALLAKRLAGRGMVMPGAALATVLSPNGHTCVPSSLLASTIKVVMLTATGKMGIGLVSGSVAALTEGVITAMFLHKLKTLTILFVLVGMLGLGGAYTLQARARADRSDQSFRTNESREPLDKDKATPSSDLERMQGTWRLINFEINGVYCLPFFGPQGGQQATIKSTKLIPNFMGGQSFTFWLDPAATPPAIDLHSLTDDPLNLGEPNKTHLGIYRLQGDELTICFVERGKQERPSTFKNYWRPGSHTVFMALARVAEGQPTQPPSPGTGKAKVLGPPAGPPNTPAAQKTDVIATGDVLAIEVTETLPNMPIKGFYSVELTGKVNLGFGYGRVKIAGQTLEEAEDTVTKHLRTKMNPPFGVRIARPVSQGTQDIDVLRRRVDELDKEVKSLRTDLNKLRRMPPL